MKHQVFDIGRWVNAYNIENISQVSSVRLFGGAGAPNPPALAVIEQLRRQADYRANSTGTALCDYFALFAGEPLDRATTKLGGVPYWPSEWAWPTAGPGEPLVFVAQVSFVDSVDLVPQLPGELLSIFARVPDANSIMLTEDDLVWFWINHTQGPAMSVELMPAAGRLFAPFRTELHRTYDIIREFSGDADDLPEDFDDIKDLEEKYFLDTLFGTKIGGIPHFIQWDTRLTPEDRVICTIGDTEITTVSQLPRDQAESVGQLMSLGDTGLVYVMYHREFGTRLSMQFS